jgi:hypothetical protein
VKVGDLVIYNTDMIDDQEIGIILDIEEDFYKPSWSDIEVFPTIKNRVRVYWTETKTVSYEPDTFLKVLK